MNSSPSSTPDTAVQPPRRGTSSRPSSAAVAETPPGGPQGPTEAPSASSACPRCAGNLIDPNGLGWCKACGYCRSLEEERARAPLQPAAAPREASRLGLAEFCGLLAKLPTWFWTLLAGIAAVLVCSLPPMLALPGESLPRCVWCTAQIVLGVLMIFAAQAWLVMLLAADDERLSFKDAILPGRVWALAFGRLPLTSRQLSLAVWGLAAILAAVFLIGGLSHWFTYLPRSTTPTLRQAIEEMSR